MALVGIAKLAAASELLEAKRRVQYFELPTRRYIGRASGRKMPFEWTVNPYRGCEFGCRYCYARYTHEFMELRDWRQFEQQIYAKNFDSERFRAELRKIPRHEAIAVGTATDPYQPAERRYEVTRRMLEILSATRGRTYSLVTKSDLVTRDIDLLQRMGAANNLHVMITITTLDEPMARVLEPFAPRPALRVEAICKLAQAGIRVVVLACPVMPLINDSERNLDAIGKAAAEAGAQYMYGNVLFLKPCAQAPFFSMLEEHFPHLVRRYRERYERGAFVSGLYPETIRERMDAVRRRHGLTSRPVEYQPDLPESGEQLTLWRV